MGYRVPPNLGDPEDYSDDKHLHFMSCVYQIRTCKGLDLSEFEIMVIKFPFRSKSDDLIFS